MKTIVMRPGEIVALADRLRVRGNSAMLRNMPALQADMVLAARVLHYLLQTGTVYRAIELD